MVLHPSVASILKKERTTGFFWAPNQRVASTRKRLIETALKTGKVTPELKRLLTRVADNLGEEVYRREEALKSAEGEGFPDAHARYERASERKGPHKPYSKVLAEDRAFIARAKRRIAAIQRATTK